MDDFVVVTYAPDDEWSGQLQVSTSWNGFRGHGVAWFNREDISDFARKLATYPPSATAIALSSGLGDGPTFQEHVGLEVATLGGKGQVAVRVHLVEPTWRDRVPLPLNELRVEFLTAYERLSRFAAELEKIVRGEAGEARLEPDVLV